MIRSFVTPEGKAIKENVARAKGYLRGGRFRKAMDAALAALAIRLKAKLFGQERLEADFQLAEFCDEFSAHPRVLEFLASIKFKTRPFLRYDRNQAEAIQGRLEILRRRWEEKLEEERQASLRRAKEEKRIWLNAAAACLASGELPKGKVYLRRVAEKYGNEPGTLVEVGKRMLGAGLFSEAAEILTGAMKADPADAELYRLLVDAYMGLGEYPQAEAVYLAAIKQFGAHPRTYLNMCELYKVWRKREKIFEYAQRALSIDPDLAEAKDLLAKYG